MTENIAGFDGEAMRARLHAEGPLTLGLEEELMLLHPETLDLAPVAGEVLDRLGPDGRFKPELAAAQIELLTEPCDGATGRERLARPRERPCDRLGTAELQRRATPAGDGRRQGYECGLPQPCGRLSRRLDRFPIHPRG